jgi:hypothetical protein
MNVIKITAPRRNVVHRVIKTADDFLPRRVIEAEERCVAIVCLCHPHRQGLLGNVDSMSYLCDNVRVVEIVKS